jgi:release factor glutamine methyltransferase
MIAATPLRTIAAVLNETALRLAAVSREDARIEAEVLLAEAWRIDRARLIARLRDVLPPGVEERFEGTVRRRLEGEPLAYILGRREFYGISIVCRRGALVPRPETELLVDAALDFARHRAGEEITVADVGTGSGAIAVAIAMHAPNVRVTAIDNGREARRLARENVMRGGVSERVDVVAGDLLSGAARFDVIVANLPYVSEAEWRTLQPEVREHEPRGALVGGALGWEPAVRLLTESPAHLNARGLIALEIGAGQEEAVRAKAREVFPSAEVQTTRDLAGMPRVIAVRRSGADR